MKRLCHICKQQVDIDPESAMDEFKQRFEDGNPLEAVVICNKCNDEIQENESEK